MTGHDLAPDLVEDQPVVVAVEVRAFQVGDAVEGVVVDEERAQDVLLGTDRYGVVVVFQVVHAASR